MPNHHSSAECHNNSTTAHYPTLLTPYDMNRIDEAINYMKQNYREAISADQLAIEVNLDIKKLQRGIRLITGYTVHNYLLSLRVACAASDLHNSCRPIKYIAGKHGFCSSSHFGSEFKKRMGMTPKNYRYQLASPRNLKYFNDKTQDEA
jgi:transcriptional regulator GlxA family with amidase domain